MIMYRHHRRRRRRMEGNLETLRLVVSLVVVLVRLGRAQARLISKISTTTKNAIRDGMKYNVNSTAKVPVIWLSTCL